MTATAQVGEFRGEPSVRLSAGPTTMTLLPRFGMLGASLRLAGGEHLSLHGGPSTYARAHTTGMPLLAPWANRLATDRYRQGRTTVDLAGLPLVGRDGNGLPMHGTVFGRLPWQVVELDADAAGERAQVAARLAFGDHPDQLRSFPFPHDLGVEVAVQPGEVSISTTVTPTGTVAVPVAFGWHPYFRVPGVRRRADLVVGLPERYALDLDDTMIPTGIEHREAAAEVDLGARTFDDAYRLGIDRRFRLSAAVSADAGPGSTLEVEFGTGYDHGQVYAPRGRAFVAFEPMTAPANALVSGAHPTVAVGDTFRATFTVRFA